MTIVNPYATQTQVYDDTQVKNGMGGLVFKVDDIECLRRFLILGTEKNQYKITEDSNSNKEISPGDALGAIRAINQSGEMAISEIVEISTSGRAPKQEPILFALAVAARHQDPKIRRIALSAVNKVCRTSTMLFSFLENYKKMGSTSGWGRLMRESIGDWYNSKSLDTLIYQTTKYANRNGWSHRDVLRLAHPKPQNQDYSTFYKWIASDGEFHIDLDQIQDKEAFNKLMATQAAKLAPDTESAVRLIKSFNLVHEHVPMNLQKSPEVWDALLDGMPLNALVRNLGRMTSYGLLSAKSDSAKRVLEKFANKKAVEKSRLHPFNILTAYNTYISGKGFNGSLEWTPNKEVSQGLNDLFYSSFGYIHPSGKRTMIGLDCSGSMSMGTILGTPGMKPMTGMAAMAMTTIRTEDMVKTMAFSHNLQNCPILKSDPLDVVMKKIRAIPMGRTNCALPMTHALASKEPYDTFVIYTDNETYHEDVHPTQALRKYREKTGIDARLVVVAMNSSGFSIADPNDKGMLDICGFDSAGPAVISEFSRGGF